MTEKCRVSFWIEGELKFTYIMADSPMTAYRNTHRLYPKLTRIERVEPVLPKLTTQTKKEL